MPRTNLAPPVPAARRTPVSHASQARLGEPQATVAALVRRAADTPPLLSPGDVLRLQRSIGNGGVGRLLARARERPAPPRPAARVTAPVRTAPPRRLQARFWGPGWKPLTYEAVGKAAAERMELSSADLDALQGMAAEELDYLLPADAGELEATLRPLITGYQRQDTIDVGKMLSVINSVLAHGILNQADRAQLGGQARASTSTDDAQGSLHVHGMGLDRPADPAAAAAQAEQDSINVLAEVKDDILFAGTRKRLAANVLTAEERTQALSEMATREEMYRLILGGGYDILKARLGELSASDAPATIDLGSDFLRTAVKTFAAGRISGSQRGWNELHKRMMTGFLTIFDPADIPSGDWSTPPAEEATGEAVLGASQPASRMVRLVLPKYLEQWNDRIVNPHHVPIVFRSINYPVQAEAHVYFASGEREVVTRNVDLRWAEEIREVLDERGSAFTHMVRGF